MKPLSLFAVAALVFSPAAFVRSADAQAAPVPEAAAGEASGAKADLKSLEARITAKLRGGTERTEKNFAAELKGFDEIIAKYRDEKADVLAEVLLVKAAVYGQLLDDAEKAAAILEEIREKYPNTKPAETAAQVLSALEREKAAPKIAASLKIGAPFPPFEEKDLNGKPISIAALKGRVVLIDFWATWCPPCIAEMPNVRAAYQKYHDKGFDVVGINLDDSRARLDAFLKKEDITWPQFFDGKGWNNVLVERYGITTIPATFLLDREGRIIGRGLSGANLGKAVAKALDAD